MSHRGGCCCSLVIWKSNSLFPLPPPQRTRRRLLRGGGGEGREVATQHATPETLDLAPEGRSGSPLRPAPTQASMSLPIPGQTRQGPRRQVAATVGRTGRVRVEKHTHSLRVEAGPATRHVTAANLLPSTQRGPRGAGSRRQGRHRCTSRAASSSSRSHGQHPPLGLARRRDPLSPGCRFPGPPGDQRKGAHATLALQWVRRHEVGHSPPPQWPSRAGPGPHSHWLSGV